MQILRAFRQAHHQPQVADDAVGALDVAFQFQVAAAVEQRGTELRPETIRVDAATIDQMLPGLGSTAHAQQAQGNLVGFREAHVGEQLTVALWVVFQPGLQLRAATQAFFAQEMIEPGQVEYAKRGAGAVENVLIAAPGFLQHASGLLVFRHIAQYPDKTQVAGFITEVAAGDAEQAHLAVLADLYQIRAEIAVKGGGVQQQRVEVRQQTQQVPLAGMAVAQAEQRLGLRVEVGQATAAVGDQHPFLDNAEHAGRLMQGASRRRVEQMTMALLAQQAIQGE